MLQECIDACSSKYRNQSKYYFQNILNGFTWFLSCQDNSNRLKITRFFFTAKKWAAQISTVGSGSFIFGLQEISCPLRDFFLSFSFTYKCRSCWTSVNSFKRPSTLVTTGNTSTMQKNNNIMIFKFTISLFFYWIILFHHNIVFFLKIINKGNFALILYI